MAFPRVCRRASLSASVRAPSDASLGSRSKLRPRDVARYRGIDPPLLREVLAVVCSTSVLPRKELFEAWEVATAVHSHFPHARRVADLAAGHGVLAWLLLLLAAEGGVARSAVCVDRRMPPSAETLGAAFTARWPSLEGRLHYVEGDVAAVVAAPEVLLTAVHACGPLSDAVLSKAIEANSPAAVMPCCHSLRKLSPFLSPRRPQLEADAPALGAAEAIDRSRMAWLRLHGFRVCQRHISEEITPYNRLILATPPRAARLRAPPPPPPPPPAAAAAGGRAPPARREAAELIPRLSSQPFAIPLADAAAIVGMAGRRQVVWQRAVDVSLWLPEGRHASWWGGVVEAVDGVVRCLWIRSDLDGGAVAILAREASVALWRSATSEQGEAMGEWDAAAAIAAARRTDCGAPLQVAFSPGERGGGDWQVEGGVGVACGSRGGAQAPPAPRVRVGLLEVYHEPSTARRACSFRIQFSSAERQITRANAALWQARIREALTCWSFSDGGFELK
ncbi:hypothetical protein AB1Y20_005935 [Prymnesium parvum]|uniref:Methyltransferase domain-containing protein n=1 Tax=Prymnesium parvum TaxID=97485 RepID=A0AB34J178_PRYPA